MLKTDRLQLRQWTEDDFLPFSKMCGDSAVMAFFPKLLTPNESKEVGKKIQSLIHERGWGFWAVDVSNQHKFIGFVGLHTPKESLPFSPCVEIGWRLSKSYWGNGYATEAAKACLAYAFGTLGLHEVVAFTALANLRSQAVMRKIGMRDSGQNFMHPDIEEAHPQCEHVLYKINRSVWLHHQVSGR